MGRRKLNKDEKVKVSAEIQSITEQEYSEEKVDKVIKNESKITKLFTNEALKKYANYVPLLFSMVKDYAAKRYKVVPVKSIVAIVSTLLYVLLPVDIIPDIIPVLGFADDASVVAWCLKFVADDLDAYKIWKESQNNPKEVYSVDDVNAP